MSSTATGKGCPGEWGTTVPAACWAAKLAWACFHTRAPPTRGAGPVLAGRSAAACGTGDGADQAGKAAKLPDGVFS